MVIRSIIWTLLLIQFIRAYPEENYPLPDNSDLNVYSQEDYDDGGDTEVSRRSNNNFLRFGRSGYDDYSGDFVRPTRSGHLTNDHFIRFGRSKQGFIRFGRDLQKVARANHLRFGRSITNDDKDGKRSKRDTYDGEYKRDPSNYLRFGRANANFMRFGRNFSSDVPNIPSPVVMDDLRKNVKDLAGKLKQYPTFIVNEILMEFYENMRHKI